MKKKRRCFDCGYKRVCEKVELYEDDATWETTAHFLCKECKARHPE